MQATEMVESLEAHAEDTLRTGSSGNSHGAAVVTHGPRVLRVQALADALDCITEQDLCELFDITPNTAETWRKRHKGPAYALVGNRVLYPRAKVREFIDAQVREWPSFKPASVL